MIETTRHIDRENIRQAVNQALRQQAQTGNALRTTAGTPTVRQTSGQYTADGFVSYYTAGDIVGSKPVGP